MMNLKRSGAMGGPEKRYLGCELRFEAHDLAEQAQNYCIFYRLL